MWSPGEEPRMRSQGEEAGWGVQERRLDGVSGGGTPDGLGVQERTRMWSPGEEAGWGVQERSPGCGVKERRLDGESWGGAPDG